MPAPSTVGQRVQAIRTALGLTQTELADRVRVGQPRISQIENDKGNGPLPVRTLHDLADALGVTLADLVAGDPLYEPTEWERPPELCPLPAGLPIPSLSLVGRDQELAVIDALLRSGEVRLLTVTGPGGVGKTHLALRASVELGDSFPEPPLRVSLVECADVAQVVAAIADELGLRERDARPLRERLLATLRPACRLVLLDNAEHLLPALLELVRDLLVVCPGLRLLVTSRTPLRLRGEHEYPVAPLALPEARVEPGLAAVAASPAVRLFVQRGRAVLPSLAITETNAATLATICRHLDGLPLAIELAASRLRTLSLDQMARSLDRRLAWLTHGPRDLPDRQQTLRAAIAWSYDLLTAEQQRLFRRLTVFAGGFTLESAKALDSFEALVDQSLVQRLPELGAEPRFAILETVREFGLEQLTIHGEVAEVHRRHLAWCRSLAEESGPKLFTTEEATWLGRLQQEDGNLRAALAWALGAGRATDLETGLRLAATLTDYWYLIGRLSEGSEWLRRAIEVSADGPATIGRARVLVGAALIEQAQAAAERARSHGEQGLTLARQLGDRPTQARALALLANAALLRAEFDRAHPLYQEALLLFRRLDDRPWIAVVLVNLGVIAFMGRDHPQAAAYADQALAIARQIGDEWDTAIALCLLGDVARERGDIRKAAALLCESIALCRRRGTCQQVANAVSAFGSLAAATGSFVQAARLFGAAESQFLNCGIEVPPPSRRDWPAAVARTKEGLTADCFAAAWAAGRALTAEQAVAEALAGGVPSPSALLEEGPHLEEANEAEALV